VPGISRAPAAGKSRPIPDNRRVASKSGVPVNDAEGLIRVLADAGIGYCVTSLSVDAPQAAHRRASVFPYPRQIL